MSERRPSPTTCSLARALDDSEPLTQLMRRLRDARARYDAVAPLIPDALKADIRSGPVDGADWTLLASHNAAAAKLRQLLPLLQQRLHESGWQGSAIKVRVQPRPAH